MQPESLVVGARVIYRDPVQPSLPLAGVVVEVTDTAVHVQYDGYRGEGVGLVARSAAAERLVPEAEYYRDRFAIRPRNVPTP